jgi:hypothetical protein
MRTRWSDRGLPVTPLGLATRVLAAVVWPGQRGQRHTTTLGKVNSSTGRHDTRQAGMTMGCRAVARQPLVRQLVTILASRNGIRPSFEAMHDRFLPNFTSMYSEVGARREAQLRSAAHARRCGARVRRAGRRSPIKSLLAMRRLGLIATPNVRRAGAGSRALRKSRAAA